MKKIILALSIIGMSFTPKAKAPTPTVSSMSYAVENQNAILITIHLSAPADANYQVDLYVDWYDYWWGDLMDQMGYGNVSQGQSTIQIEVQASDIGIGNSITLEDPFFLN